MPDMRFAPPAALRLADHGGGLNQTSVRAYNERLVISLLRKHESLSRQSIMQMSGLSAQTVSVIANALERDHLTISGEPVRGRVGPPSRLLSLNPEGAYAIGIKIGQKSTDMLLMDFVGTLVQHVELTYDFPQRHAVTEWIAEQTKFLFSLIPTTHRARLVGIGVSLPDTFETWPSADWPEPRGQKWSEINIEEWLAEISGVSVYIQNDVTAAASAEVIFGAAKEINDFAYFFVGAFTSSRLVLNHHIHSGRETAGVIASLSDLANSQTSTQGPSMEEWTVATDVEQQWVETCATGILERFNVLTTFVDLNTIIIDGRMPAPVLEKICVAVQEKSGDSGTRVSVTSGTIGPFAKAVGAASLPFHSRFMLDDVGLADPAQ